MSTGTDRAAVIVALTATLNAGLAEDEAAAQAAAGPDWFLDTSEGYDERSIRYTGPSTLYPGQLADYSIAGRVDEDDAAHIARHDPARTLREVRAKRDLIAAILAERHDYTPCVEYYSCSQAVGDDPDPNVSLARGSGCSDPDRAGQPCDCGRDARVERLLRIVATVYEEGGQP